MLKMLLDPMGGIVLTNDGHAILREIEVSHPAAKSMIELSRTQDEEVGDGTTTVIILGMTLAHLEMVYLTQKNSRRDAGPSPPPARTKHPPRRHHLCLQARARRCPHYHRGG